MKTILISMIALSMISTAKADGFNCEGVNTGIKVQVYNYTLPEKGTRKVATMIISDSYVKSGNKTIALFTDENHTLSYKGYGVFQANVDLRYIESRRKGENIGGTKLGYLKNIILEVDSQYGKQTKSKEIYDARITYIKRSGETSDEKAICSRYLKH